MSTAHADSAVKERLLSSLETCQEVLRSLAASLPESLENFEDAEQQIRQTMLELGRCVLQQWSDAAEARASRPTCHSCGGQTRHKGYVRGPLVTMLGVVRIQRPRFRCEACGKDGYPHDDKLRFLAHGVSWGLAKVVGRLGARLSFDQAREHLHEDYGVRLSKQTVEQLVESAGQRVLEAEDQARERFARLAPAEQLAARPKSTISPAKTYVLADGTMLHSDGDWHEIRLACVASLDADEQPLRVEQRARFLSCTDFGHQLLLLAWKAGYGQAKLRAFIADGARWLWEMADLQFPEAIQILDWYHLSEHVHQAAAVVFGEGSDAAKQWSEARLDELWNGHSTNTLVAIGQQRASCRSPSKREALRKLRQYLEHNHRRIDYPRYRALGLQVGSGRVEGACKSLVGGRCKQAGMRNWTRRGAEGVLRLRAALQTGHYDELWASRLNPAA